MNYGLRVEENKNSSHISFSHSSRGFSIKVCIHIYWEKKVLCFSKVSEERSCSICCTKEGGA